MERSSIHLRTATRKRLAKYRPSGASYDDVLSVFMDAIDPAEFKARWSAARADLGRQLLGAPPARSAAAGMEAAFRLYELGRERA